MAQTARYVEGTQPGRSHGGRFHSTGAGSTLAEEPLPVAPGASRRVSPSGSSHPVSGSATVLSDPVPAASSHPATATAMGPRRPPSRCLPLPAASPLAPAGKGRCADPAPAADPLPSLPPTSLTWSSWARACRGEVHAACVRSGETTLSRDVLIKRDSAARSRSAHFSQGLRVSLLRISCLPHLGTSSGSPARLSPEHLTVRAKAIAQRSPSQGLGGGGHAEDVTAG